VKRSLVLSALVLCTSAEVQAKPMPGSMILPPPPGVTQSKPAGMVATTGNSVAIDQPTSTSVPVLPRRFVLSAQKNLSAKEFIQNLARQAGLTLIFIESGGGSQQASGVQTVDKETPVANTLNVGGVPLGGAIVASGNSFLNTSSTTPGIESSGTSEPKKVPLPGNYNLTFGNLTTNNPYALFNEVVDLMGFRAFASRTNPKIIYISDKLATPKMVRVRVRVFNLNDTLAKEKNLSIGSGLSGSYDANGNPVAFGRAGVNLGVGNNFSGSPFPAFTGLSSGGGGTGSVANISNNGAIADRTTITFGFGAIALQIQLLQRESVLESLLDQEILINDGETATISQNIQFRIPSAVVTNGAVLAATQVVNAKTLLKITPVVLPSTKQVQVSIAGDFTDVQGSGNDLVLTTNSLKVDNLRMDSGGATFLGGATRRAKAIIQQKVPLLGDLPLVGELFNSRQNSETASRLIILLEPVIQSQPLAGPNLAEQYIAPTVTPSNVPSSDVGLSEQRLGPSPYTDPPAVTPATNPRR
jgi:type IV pilus assembly protein PilQ